MSIRTWAFIPQLVPVYVKNEINETMNIYRSLGIFLKKYRTNERT